MTNNINENINDNKEKKYFRVAITETLRRIVTVEAEDEDDACQRVSDGWCNSEYVLDCEDFDGVEFYAVGNGCADDLTDGEPHKGDTKTKGAYCNE